MFKQALHKLFSAVMAVLVMFSTVSFTVEKHFCGDILIDSAVFSEAQKCNMEAFETRQSTITSKRCCKDVFEVVEGQDQLKQTQFEDTLVEQQVFAILYPYLYTNSLEELPKLFIPHKDYAPPNLIQDIQVLDEVFLI